SNNNKDSTPVLRHLIRAPQISSPVLCDDENGKELVLEAGKELLPSHFSLDARYSRLSLLALRKSPLIHSTNAPCQGILTDLVVALGKRTASLRNPNTGCKDVDFSSAHIIMPLVKHHNFF
ncbi:hypothetical protein BaRGS_00035294, partial [Batillaria attramentaria]